MCSSHKTDHPKITKEILIAITCAGYVTDRVDAIKLIVELNHSSSDNEGRISPTKVVEDGGNYFFIFN